MLRRPIALATFVLLAQHAAAIDFSPVTTPIGEYVASKPRVPGAGLLIVDFNGQTLHEQYWGKFDRQSVVRIGSATKWLSGAAVMSVVDDGLIGLDTRADAVLPEFVDHPAAGMTVRQMFSHTASAPGGSSWVNDRTVTLAEAVAGIAANETWLAPSGETFHYGGVSMHVAGRATEVAAGVPWESLFDDRLLTPLGITDTDFDGLGPTTNPRIAGGARSSVDSYARFLRMLADGGVFEGDRVLSQASVDAMLSDQTGDAVLDSAPPTVDEYLGYGVGSWVFRRNDAGEPVEWGSPGLFGAVPWIDTENRYFGIFLIDDLLQNVDGLVDDVRAFTRDALSLAGDYNLDGVVDEADLDTWRDDFSRTDGSRADGNGDGVVDAADYVVWRDAVRTTVVTTPEPSTAAMALMLVALAGLDLKPHRLTRRRVGA
ncbi:MAG: serine hydrolase [Planctomycetota bacterium]